MRKGDRDSGHLWLFSFKCINYLIRTGLEVAMPAPFTRMMYCPLARPLRLNECSPALRLPR